ncbi:MAG: matrixin family metalloprotease [Nocardioidaceae bacterium]|nr:matrixin family metalloprotease [Nocardioidaceae bacterium]MCL2611912.1 matrixin family metalloprotease [Nocardioidaceae bacterium]
MSRIAAALGGLVLAATTILATATPSEAVGAYSVEQVVLPSGQTTVVRWDPCRTITYAVNLAGLPASRRGEVLWEVQTAVQNLSEWTGLRFSYQGTTAAVPQVGASASQPADLLIAYTTPWQTDFDLTGGRLGEGGNSYYTWPQRYSDGSTRWEAAITRGWAVLDASDMYQLLRPGFGYGTTTGNLLLHELGHAVGLQHVGDYSQLMAPVLTASAPNGYGSGDGAGLARVGSSYGCIDVPSSLE